VLAEGPELCEGAARRADQDGRKAAPALGLALCLCKVRGMPIRIVRLGTPRTAAEGTRIGTVRRPPRGVPKARFAADDWYDVWFPLLAPSVPTMKLAQAAATPAQWAAFARKYRAEMAEPAALHALNLLAALSRSSAFSVGCYCADAARCHRSLLRELLHERGADLA
jgi:uncharacterized protein YeaO (DUF488 family)